MRDDVLVWGLQLIRHGSFVCFGVVIVMVLASKGGVLQREKNDSPRGSRSGGTEATAEGRSQGLKERRKNELVRFEELGVNGAKIRQIHTTSVLVDFGGVDERHGGDRRTVMRK
jgi:hypothetical protein